jgi:transcriptional regulator with XRE-family HTH domain
MSQIRDKSNFSVGDNIRSAREGRGWSGAQLATAAGVSRSMIDRIERNVSSPTTDLLGKLSAALETTMSSLLAPAAPASTGIERAGEKPVWEDPDSGYRRRQIAKMPTFAVDLTEVVLPPAARVAYPAGAYAFVRHLVWVIDGTLSIRYGDDRFDLSAGDSTLLPEPRDLVFVNETAKSCRYVVAVAPNT